MSEVLLQGGRYYWENAATYLIGSKRQGDFNKPKTHESEKDYLAKLTTMGYDQAVIKDIFFLKKAGLPHVETASKFGPETKLQIVHANYRLATYLISVANPVANPGGGVNIGGGQNTGGGGGNGRGFMNQPRHAEEFQIEVDRLVQRRSGESRQNVEDELARIKNLKLQKQAADQNMKNAGAAKDYDAAAGYQQNIVAIQSQIVDAESAWNEPTRLLKSMKRRVGNLEKERDALNTRQKFLEAKEKNEQIVLLNTLCGHVNGLVVVTFQKAANVGLALGSKVPIFVGSNVVEVEVVDYVGADIVVENVATLASRTVAEESKLEDAARVETKEQDSMQTGFFPCGEGQSNSENVSELVRRAREQADREQAARDQVARERAAREQAAREQAAREQAAREQVAREQAARERAAREQAAREQRAREEVAAEQRFQRSSKSESDIIARVEAAGNKITKDYGGGNVYYGQMYGGKRHGYGTYTWGDGRKYVGEYKNDKYDGYGIYTDPYGHKYVGEYKNGQYHGHGTWTRANGTIKHSGKWVNNKPKGEYDY